MTTDIVPELEVSHRHRLVGHWSRNHPAFRGDEPTMGERAADRMRYGMGSWAFVFIFIAFMVIWAIVNTIVIARVLHGKPFDPFPYVLLNLFLSMLAGLQGAILLISAKRGDAIAGKLAMHTDMEATKAEERSARVELLLQKLYEHAFPGEPVPTVPSTVSLPADDTRSTT